MYRREISVGVAIAVLGAILAFTAPGMFTWRNQLDLVMANLPVLIAAIGMTMVIITGQIDISIGSQFAIAGLCACTVGAAFGTINGLLVSYARMPSIVVTLAMMVALRDGLRWATQG